MEEKEEPVEQETKRKWVIPTVTTLIGIIVSIVVAWYQINLSEEQTLQAENERTKAVKNELVLIVEEHVINQKPLDISRLARMSEFRAKQEKLLIIPSVSEIIENAEFNILKSQYLEFEKKQLFKVIFNGIYAELTIPQDAKYSGLFENTVNEIYASLQKGSTKGISVKVNKLVSDFNLKISELEAVKGVREKTNINDMIKAILDQPGILIIVMSMYMVISYMMVLYLKKKRRHRVIKREVYEEYLKERSDVLHGKLRKDKDRHRESEERPNK